MDLLLKEVLEGVQVVNEALREEVEQEEGEVD